MDDTPTLQCGLECALTGVTLTPSKQFGLQTALENLRQWRESSVALDHTEDYELPYLDGDGSARIPGSNTVVARTCVAQINPGRDLLVTQLRSRYRGIPPKQWSVKPEGVTPVYFEMDQSQDLLAVIQVL